MRNVDDSRKRPSQVDGIDYSPVGIENLRQWVIEMRNDVMKLDPPRFDIAVPLSHVIALLAYLKEMIEE